MTKEKPLYEDVDLKITYLLDEKGNMKEAGEHELHITNSENRYVLQRGILKELAFSDRPGLVGILRNLNPHLMVNLMIHGLTPDAVGVAAHQAIVESEKRFEEYMSKNY